MAAIQRLRKILSIPVPAILDEGIYALPSFLSILGPTV